jgi:GNAT superfamily N-acetyltransferase
VLKNSVREKTEYTVGDTFESESFPQSLSSRDEDAMVMAGLMGNRNGAFISMSNMGSPSDETSQIETRTSGDLSLTDVEAIYVSGKDAVRELTEALDADYKNIKVVDIDHTEPLPEVLSFLANRSGQIQSSVDELQEDLPKQESGTPERQMSEKAKVVRKNLSMDNVPEIVATERMSFGDKREYLEGRGSYLTPNGDMIDLVFEEKRNYFKDGGKYSDTVTITAFDDNYNLVGLLEVNMVDVVIENGERRYTFEDIDEVAHPEILGKRFSNTPIAEISWIKVEDDYQRQGIGTALLEFARDGFPMPIYHSNNLSPAGRGYSKAVQTSENVEEDLPSVEETTSKKPIPPLVEDQPPKPEATAEASDKARIVRERALEIEPKITEDVAKVANISGGVLKSLENRIKTTKSLARKIDKDAVELFNGDRADAALRISDAVRYTMVTSTKDYVTVIKQVKAEFLDLGYEVQNEKNFWKSDEYKGFTFKLVSPEGYAVEFQIHTNESYEIKDDLHKLYEELRAIPVDALKNVPRARQLSVELKRLADLIPVPDEELFEIGKLIQYNPDKKLTRLGEEFKDVLDTPKSQAPQTSDTLTEELPVEDTSGVDVDLWGDPILPPVEGYSYDDNGNYKYGPKGEKSKSIFKRIVPTNEYMDENGDMVFTAEFTDEEGTKFNLVNIVDGYASNGTVSVYSTGAYPQKVGEITYSEVPISDSQDEYGLLTWDRDQLPPWYPEENYDIYSPFATIDVARVSPAQQRRGLATAMLEYARSTNNMPIHHSYNLSSMGLQFAQAIQNAPTLEIENEDLPELDEVKSVAERITYGPQNQGDSLFQQTATYKAEDGTEYKMDMQVYVNPESPFKNKTANIEIIHEGKFVGRLSWRTAYSYFEEDGEQVWLPRSEINRVAPESIDSVDTSKPFSIIDSLAVSEDSRRKGIATAMLTFARESSDEPIYHSQDRSDDGKAFSRAVQSPVLLEDMDELPVRDDAPFRDTRLNRRPDRRAVRRLARRGLNSKERAESKRRNRLVDSPDTIGDKAKFTPESVVLTYAEELRRANLERINFSERVTTALNSLEEDGITKRDIAESIYKSENLSPWEGKTDISRVLVLDSVTGKTLTMAEYGNRREVNEKTEMLEDRRGKKREVTFTQAKEILREYGGYDSGNRRYVLLADTEVSVPTIARRHIEKTFRELDKNLSSKPETSQQLEEELPTYDYEPISSKSREVAERIVEDPSKTKTGPDAKKVLDNVDNEASYWLRLYMGSDSILDFDETFTLEDYKRLDEYRLNPPETEITVSEREHVATYKAVGGGDTYKLTMTVKEIKDSKTGKVLAVSGRGEASSEKDFTSGGEFLFASPNVNGIDEQGNFLYDARFIARETRDNITRDDLKKPFGFVTGVYVDEDVQRQGIATALLEFARQKAGVPIYHSSNRSDEGYAFSTAVKSPQLVEEDLPPLAEGQSSEGRTLSEKSKEVKARISTNSPRTEVRKDAKGNPIYQAKGTYTTPSGEVLNLLLEDTESTDEQFDIRYINGFVDISDKNSRVLGSVSFGVPYDYSNYPNELPYDIESVDRDIHPEADPNNPFAIINFISVFPQRQREGIATAMLEFARENYNLPIYHSIDRTARGNAFADAVQSPETSDEELPTPTVASSIVSERDKNIQELLDTNAIASIEDATKIKEYGAGVSSLDLGTTISLGLGQHETRSDKFMQRLWELNLQYLQKSLGTIDWKVEQQTIDKMRAMGLSDRASKRAATGALLAAKAYAKVKNFAEAMSKIAKTMAEEFPEDRWFAGYYKRALVTREVLKDKLKTAVPVISADFDSALGIISDKRFKTQWETGSSNGLYEPSTREKREFGLLAVDPKTPKGKRPIYGFMATDDDGKTPMAKPHNMDLFAVNNRAITQYGDVRFVLKPETRERTTFTMQDSLDVIALPQPLSDNPTDEQIDMAGFWQNVTDSHDGFFREPYVEAQVSGGISMEDVERIVVSVPYYTDYPEAQAKFLKRKVDTLRAELEASGYENIQITTVTETPSESYQDEAMNISGIPL